MSPPRSWTVSRETRVSEAPPMVRARRDNVRNRHFLAVVRTAAQVLRCLIDYIAIAPPIADAAPTFPKPGASSTASASIWATC